MPCFNKVLLLVASSREPPPRRSCEYLIEQISRFQDERQTEMWEAEHADICKDSSLGIAKHRTQSVGVCPAWSTRLHN